MPPPPRSTRTDTLVPYTTLCRSVDLFQWSSRSFLLGPLVGTMLSLPSFDGGQRQAGIDRARARYEEDVARYRQTVLSAFRDVEDGLSSLRILGEQSQVQDAEVKSASRAAQL